MLTLVLATPSPPRLARSLGRSYPTPQPTKLIFLGSGPHVHPEEALRRSTPPGEAPMTSGEPASERHRPSWRNEMPIVDYLRYMVEAGASDLHVKVGLPPMVRIDGVLHRTP